jgi:puromycin-sensitive aminopeptidase
MSESNAKLLPSTISPKKYSLHLEPDMEKFTYEGFEEIMIQVHKKTSIITMNSLNLNIESSKIEIENEIVNAIDISINNEEETMSISFPQEINLGIYKLSIKFNGTIPDNLTGFYRSQYQDTSGNTKWLVTTQFEPGHARLAFPCWDEPALKASFQLDIQIPALLQAYSNMPIEKEEIIDKDTKIVSFQETPLMSTYLLAFLVGDMSLIESKSSSGTLIRVITTKGRESFGKFALDTSLKLLSYFNSYFGIPFPLKKLDHVAIPDFAAGAMENWGLITYRETALLVDPENSASATKQRVAEVISHEMAHMWFGDLVTMKWWNDLWLNESFASWMGDKAIDAIFPEWEMWTEFVSADTVRAFDLDSLETSHPIEAEVTSPAEVEQLFDAISYSKGGSLIRMLENFLGEKTFQSGLYQYLSKHQYSNASTDDLWKAMESASQKPVKSIMDTWLKQMGYPVISIESNQSTDTTKLKIRQSRFLATNILGSTKKGTPSESTWKIPLRIKSSGEEDIELLLESNTAELDINHQKTLIFNPEQTGFFRIIQPQNQLNSLRQMVENKLLPPTERLGLQNDVYALGKAGYIQATEFMQLISSYTNEEDTSVWRDVASNIGDLDNLLSDENIYPLFKAFALNLFLPLADKMGWKESENETHLKILLRSLALSQAGYFGNQKTLDHAAELFDDLISNNQPVPPNLRGCVYSLAAMGGSKKTYEQLWTLQKNATLQEEKMRLLGALSRFQEKDLLNDLLERSLSNEVRPQDAVSVITAIAMNSSGKHLAWEFIKSNWGEFDKRYGRGGFALMRLAAIPGNFADNSMLEDVTKFFETHPAPAASLTIQQSIEQIKVNTRWLEINNSEIGEFLKG